MKKARFYLCSQLAAATQLYPTATTRRCSLTPQLVSFTSSIFILLPWSHHGKQCLPKCAIITHSARQVFFCFFCLTGCYSYCFKMCLYFFTDALLNYQQWFFFSCSFSLLCLIHLIWNWLWHGAWGRSTKPWITLGCRRKKLNSKRTWHTHTHSEKRDTLINWHAHTHKTVFFVSDLLWDW